VLLRSGCMLIQDPDNQRSRATSRQPVSRADCMENALQAILDNLPTRRRRSKLEPYAELIRALRGRGQSYREIVTILRERCGLRVAMHTVYYFVHARPPKNGAPRPRRRPRSEPVGRASEVRASLLPCSPDGPEEVRARIAAVMRRRPAPAVEKKAFEYDENEPLQLIPDDTPRRR
jgi:hypothetical protein